MNTGDLENIVTTTWRRGRRVGLFEGVVLGLIVGGTVVALVARFT